MDATRITYHTGLPEHHRTSAAALYDEAFGGKFSLAVGCAESRRRLLRGCLCPAYAIVALAEGRLVGIAGLHTADGSLTGGITGRELFAQLGLVKGCRAALVFSMYERTPVDGELVMDGIAVHSDARGEGVGGRLLDEVAAYAAAHGFDRVRLDVIDTNPGARKLYERKGFHAVKTERFGYLRWLLKFGASTTMLRRVGETGGGVTR